MNQIKLAESILLEKFKTEPFHNFRRLKETSAFVNCNGGTCSDKAISYVKALEKNGILAYLHSAIIDGQFNHQLVRIEYEGTSYFGDVGNGWPSVFVYPCNKEVKYRCYGMQFRTEIQGDLVKVFHTRNGRETIQMEFNSKPQSQQLIKKNIDNRFSNNIQYPFDTGLRLSLIVDDSFLFIRDSNLEIYSNKGFKRVGGISMINFQSIVKKYFSIDLFRIL